jgi:hypothetical protein
LGWAKGLELAKLARRDRQHFDCAIWLHEARQMRTPKNSSRTFEMGEKKLIPQFEDGFRERDGLSRVKP